MGLIGTGVFPVSWRICSLYLRVVLTVVSTFFAADLVFAYECQRVREAAKEVIPSKDPFYQQVIEKIICAGAEPTDPSLLVRLVTDNCSKGVNPVQEKKENEVTIACARFDRRNRLIGYRGPFVEMRADHQRRFHLISVGRYYAGARKEKLWLKFDMEERLTSIEYYEVGVDNDRLTVLSPEGRLVEAGKIRFSQLENQYYRIGRWKRGNGESDLIYDAKGGQFAIDDLRKLTTTSSRQLNAEFSSRRMFYPVQNGRVLLPISCTTAQSYRWSDTAESFLQGMKPGDSVIVIDRAGQDVPATLGSLECFSGKCGEHLLAVVLKSERPLTRSHFAIARRGDGKTDMKALPEADAYQLVEKDQDFYEMLAGGDDIFLGVTTNGAAKVRVLKAEFSGICCPQSVNFTEFEVPIRTKVPKIVATYVTPGQTCD